MAQRKVSEIVRILRRYGIRHSDCIFLDRYIHKQVTNRGKEGAVAFLKRIGNQIQIYLSGSGKRLSWLSLDKSGYPKAILQLKHYPSDVQYALAKLARTITFDNVTESQLSKVVSGITDEGVRDTEGMSKLIELGSSSLGLFTKSSQPCDPKRVTRTVKTHVTTGDGHRLPNVVGLVSAPIEQCFQVLRGFPALQNLPYWKESFYPIHPDDCQSILDSLPELPAYAGVICGQQESGGKLRAFAAPSTVIQALMYPIHHWIAEYNKTIPNCCSYAQEIGAIEAQKVLKEGGMVHSVDLSTATCRFPLEVQLDLLRSLGLDSVYIDALEKVCRADWKVLAGMGRLNGSTLAWKVGQPLGLAPSMSMFTLTHICLIAGICKVLKVPSSSFYVLGDDVVIFNSKVAEMYKQVMVDHGVSISWDKTFDSSSYAEFAGYNIQANNLFRVGQMKSINSDNFLSTIEQFGPQEYLSDHWNEIQQYYFFKQGKTTCPPHLLKKFLRANSYRVQHEFDFHVKSGVDWYDWIKEEINSLYPSARVLRYQRTPFAFIYQLFPSNPFFMRVIDEHFLDQDYEAFSRPTHLTIVQCDITLALMNSVRCQYMTEQEAKDFLAKCDAYMSTDIVCIDKNENISALQSLTKELKSKAKASDVHRFYSERVIKTPIDSSITIESSEAVLAYG